MSNLSFSERYSAAVQTGAIEKDPFQEEAVKILSEVAKQLAPARLWLPWKHSSPALKGVYLWGGVGRGKTFLMDLFFESVLGIPKQRWHFHRFMQWLHQRLALHTGEKDPLLKIAKALGKEAQLLCFDELVVTDIGDAMLLGGFLQALFREKVVLVATSNAAPSMLYQGGLQRALFLPAIAALEVNMQVIELKGACDYRLQYLQDHLLYFYPITAQTAHDFLALFKHLACGQADIETGIMLEGRWLQTEHQVPGVIWFSFKVLCGMGRSVSDYIALSKQVHTLLLSDVPGFTQDNENEAKRFIHLIDECYDRKVKMIISSTTAIARLYQGALLSFEFERTKSRLYEMQSADYLALAHKP